VSVSVALPVLDGGALLDEVLAAVRAQRVPSSGEVEIVVVDSGSTDGSVDVARRHGATVIEIDRSEFSHGGTRDLLMRSTHGDHVAFLTQDAVPAGDGWLAALLRGFDRADDVALVYGPYLPRPGAPHWVRRELTEFFGSEPRVDRGVKRFGDGTFYSDANGCILRSAYERVPYRPVSYAEDQLLATDMLAAGYAKAYEPDAAVVHSHDYSPLELFGRLFDEFRALREVHGHVEEAGPRHTLGTVRRQVARDRAFLRSEGVAGAALDRGTLESLRFYAIRASAAALGTRADRLPAPLRRTLSRDGRATFDPVSR
jgi:glycosyltransferase involved in cell wall biosynthesis